MPGHGVVPFPGLGGAVAERLDVRCRVERITVSVVQSELHHLRADRDSVGVVGLDLDGVLALVTETEQESVPGVGVVLAGHFRAVRVIDRICGTDNPDRHDAVVVHIEGDVVGLLVNLHLHVKVSGLRKLRLIRSDVVRRAGCHKGGGHRQCDIFQCCLHIHSRLVVVLYEVRILVKLGLRDRPVFLGLGPVVLAELVVGSLED